MENFVQRASGQVNGVPRITAASVTYSPLFWRMEDSEAGRLWILLFGSALPKKAKYVMSVVWGGHGEDERKEVMAVKVEPIKNPVDGRELMAHTFCLAGAKVLAPAAPVVEPEAPPVGPPAVIDPPVVVDPPAVVDPPVDPTPAPEVPPADPLVEPVVDTPPVGDPDKVEE